MDTHDDNGPGPKRALGILAMVALCVSAPWAAERALAQSSPAMPNAIEGQAPADQPQAQKTPRKLSLEDRADIFMARKEFGDAEDYYMRALKADKERQAPLWNKLGIAFQQQERFGPARRAYKKAIHFQKDFPEAWNNLGTTYFLQGKAKKSVKYYERAVKLNPSGASFHLNLGSGYFKSKKYEKAVAEYRTALTLDPDILREHSPEGSVLEARAGGDKLYFCLAKAFASIGQADEAVRYLRRAFEDGFHDRDLLGKDPDFKKISTNPAYVDLLNHPPVPIKD